MTALVINTAVSSLNHRIERVDSQVKRGTSIAQAFQRLMFSFVSNTCARMTDRLAEELANSYIQLKNVREAIASEANPERVIDPDMVFDQLLDNMKASLERIAERSGSVAQSAPEQFASARDAMLRIQKIALETRSAVISLQWEVAEHDAPLLGRVEDATAASKEELDALLERICTV